MDLYSRINKVEKVSRKFASRIERNNERYIFIALSTSKVVDGVLTSSLEQAMFKLFFGTQALPKNRGACVDTRFWHGQELI